MAKRKTATTATLDRPRPETITVEAQAIEPAPLSREKAEGLVHKIKTHLQSARMLIEELHEGRGWVALGYETWEACIHAEFVESRAHIYRLLKANEIEKAVNGTIGEIPEGQLRPLAQLPEPERKAAWEEAKESANGKPTGKVVQDVVDQKKSPIGDRKPNKFEIGDRLVTIAKGMGEVTAINGYSYRLALDNGEDGWFDERGLSSPQAVEESESPSTPLPLQVGDSIKLATTQQPLGTVVSVTSEKVVWENPDGKRDSTEYPQLLVKETELTEEELRQEMYTPDEIIAECQVLFQAEAFALDPCSNSKTNPNLPAKLHYTREDDGLRYLWEAENMLFNPPYSPNGTIELWIKHWIECFEEGLIQESVGLFPANSAEKWFQHFAPYLVGYPAKRLSYKNTSGSARFSSCLVYLGQQPRQFIYAFNDLCNGNIRQIVTAEDFE